MGICVVHTADWQIGKPFGGFPDTARVTLAQGRIEAVKRVAVLASDRRADAVLVAGDVFDTGGVADETIRRTLYAMEAFGGPWVLLPGNHDAALAESPWTRITRFGKPANIVLATEPEPVVLSGGRCTVLPAPLRHRHEVDDLTAWFDAAPSADGSIRIGLAHGSVAALLPIEAEAPNPIAHDRAARAGLDYLALGDWHGTLSVDARTWYAGTPEPDRFRANDQGNALVVRIDAARAPPRVEKVQVGRHAWMDAQVSIHGADDIGAIDGAIGKGGSLADLVVNLRLAGVVDFRTRATLEARLDELRARLLCLLVDDAGLLAEPSVDDLDRIDQLGFVRAAVDRLRARAADPADGARDVARLALQILYQEHVRQRG